MFEQRPHWAGRNCWGFQEGNQAVTISWQLMMRLCVCVAHSWPKWMFPGLSTNNVPPIDCLFCTGSGDRLQSAELDGSYREGSRLQRCIIRVASEVPIRSPYTWERGSAVGTKPSWTCFRSQLWNITAQEVRCLHTSKIIMSLWTKSRTEWTIVSLWTSILSLWLLMLWLGGLFSHLHQGGHVFIVWLFVV